MSIFIAMNIKKGLITYEGVFGKGGLAERKPNLKLNQEVIDAWLIENGAEEKIVKIG